IRSAWANARNEALSSGRTMLFRYQPQSDLYTVGAWQGLDADAQAETEADSGNATAQAAAATAVARQWHLPEGITFVGGRAQADTRSDMVITSDTGDGTTDATMPPIVFYPDGTTSTAQVELVNSRGVSLQVNLRGLTGVTSVGQPTNQNMQP